MKAVALWLFCTLMTTWHYIQITLAYCQGCNLQIERIATGVADAPFSYRLITPAILMAMGNTPQALVVFHGVCFAVFFALLAVWANRWQVSGLVVMPVFALVLTIMFRTWYFSAWTVLEWDIWLLGLLCLPRWSLSEH